MQINIHTQNIELQPEHEAYIRSKIQHLSHFGGGVDDESVVADVHVKKALSHGQGVHVEMKVNIRVPHNLLHAKIDQAMQVTEAVDLIVDKLKQQIGKSKGKR